jgi:hypothetical protein
MRKFPDDNRGALTTVVAYNAFFAIFPLLLVVVTVLGFLLGRDSGLQQGLLGSAVAEFPIIGNRLQDNIHSGRPPDGVIGGGVVRNCRIARAASWSRSAWRSPPRRSSSPATSTGNPARAPPGHTTTTWSPLEYKAQRPWRLWAEQVGVPSGISPVSDDPSVATRALVIAVGWSLFGWSLLWRSRARG